MVKNEEKTLRQILLENFSNLGRKISEVKGAIEILAISQAIGDVEMDQLKLQIAGLSESLQDLEHRVIALEKHANVASWIIRQIAFLGFVGGVVWLVISYNS